MSCIIKNNVPAKPIPPKSLNEAGTMAICHTKAWDAKVVTSAWWVRHDQVSKTAPSGEYLSTGGFLIRGKKNYLPPSYLVYGFGFMFKVDEDSVFRHRGERKVMSAAEVAEEADSKFGGKTNYQLALDVRQDDEDDKDDEEDNAEKEEDKEDKGKENGDEEDDNSGESADEEEEEEAIGDAADSPAAGKQVKFNLEANVKKEEFVFPDTELKVDYEEGTLAEDERKHSPQGQQQQNEGKSRMTAKERRDRRKQKRKAKNGVVANDDDDDNDDGS